MTEPFETPQFDEAGTLSLISQIISGVSRGRSEDNEGLDVVLAEINRLTSRWQHSPAVDTPTTSKVMFALNPDTTGWAAAGVDPSEVKTWELIGFTPELAQQWSEAHLTLTHALRWSGTWGLKNFNAHDIAAWEHSGLVAEPNTVTMWLRCSVPTARAIEWTRLGGSYYDGRDWLNGYPDAPVADLYATAGLHLSASQVKPWLTRGIVGQDIAGFLDKGYTPAAARKHLDGGGTVADAADKRGGAPVPGRSWKRIAAAIDENSDVTYKVTQHVGITAVHITHAKHSDPVEVTFRKNGQFTEAEICSQMQRRMINGQTHTWTTRRACNLTELLTYLENWK